VEKFYNIILVTFVVDAVTLTSLKRRHNYFYFDSVTISLKNHNLAKSRNISHQNWK